MKKSKKKKNKKRIANNYLGMAAIAIVVLLLLGGLTYQSQTLKARIAVYDAKASALEDSIAGEQERTQEIDEQKEYMQTDEISLVWSKEMRSYLKKRNKGDFAEKFSGTISFI